MSRTDGSKPVPERRQFLAYCGGAIATGMAGSLQAIVPGANESGNGYAGMDDSASWRRDALQRIDDLRQGDFSLRLQDAAGAPVESASVEIELHRHEFGFGAGVRLSRFFGSEYPAELRERYLQICSDQFHKLVTLNAFKWKHIDRNEQYIEPFLEWSEAENLPVRGHTLVWPDFKRAPASVTQFAKDPHGLRDAIRAHLKRVAGKYAGRIAEWDVLNEPFSQHTYMDILGKEVAAEWFRQVEVLDPGAKRYINDYGVLTRPNGEHQDFYFKYIGWLLEQGAPVQGIGFQSHNPAAFALTPPEELLATLERFSVHGLEQQVTEFDVETTDQDLQARYTMDFMIAVFSHASVTGLMTWTPFEYARNVVSKPDAAFFDRQLRTKPNAIVWDDLVNNRWSTQVRVGTDHKGQARFRGFAGTYNVRTKAGSSTQEHKVTLGRANTSASISLI